MLFAANGAVGSSPGQRPSATINPSPDARILPPPPNYSFPNGRRYVYNVEWHLLTAGTASVKMEPDGTEQRVSAVADSSGVVKLLYTVHDRFEAHLDPHSFCSLRIFKHSEEGSHKRDTSIHFDYQQEKSLLDEKNLKTGELKHAANNIPDCVTDVISGFYYLASLPLQPGNSYNFPLNDGGETAEVATIVEAKETIKTPLGTFSTVRVAAVANSGALKGKGKVWVWYTDDANHTAVQMRAKMGFGTLLFKLQKIES